LQHRGLSIVIDPYLSYSVDQLPDAPSGFWRRNYPPPVSPDQLRHIGLILCTHDHLDHTDPASLRDIAKASPDALFAGPRQAAGVMLAAGIAASRVHTLEAGVTFEYEGVRIEPVAAAHEDYEQDEAGHYVHLGYLICWAGITFFHAGDTTATERLSGDLGKRRIDVAFLPINGRSQERARLGVVGNMNGCEAAALAARHSVELLVPTHFDLYANNGASLAGFVQDLETIAPEQRFKAFRPGEQMLYPVANA
jgi:L-ascorbate metabolism protein UlaG (beta-lactamase superfamily)